MAELIHDTRFRPVQVFAPGSIVAVVASIAWTPSKHTVAFCVPTDCNYTLNGSGLTGSLTAGDIRGVLVGATYTFDTNMNIEVM